MRGYFNRYLDVDLTSGKLQDREIPDEWERLYLGGYGIADRLLLEELKPGVDPLGPENILVFATGPMQGSGYPGGGRHVVAGKSPKTNAVSDSYSGGYFPHELGRSGYDGVLVRGRSERPVYLHIADGRAKLRDAGPIWGQQVRETEDWLKGQHGRVRVASIGPAGENLVLHACVMNDYNRAAGRPGFGAVMGSKNLKAIAVKGSKDKEWHDFDRLKELRREYARWLSKDPRTLRFGQYGSALQLVSLSDLGMLPTRNFSRGVFANAQAIGGMRMAETILVDRDTCTGCPVRCKRVFKTSYAGQPVEEAYGGLEYESVAALGSLCLVDNLDALALANQKCNAYGLDTISTGVTVAFAMEASEKGIIKEPIAWGDPDALLRLIDDIAYQRGLGKDLAKGVARLAREWNADFAVHTKGQEIALHDSRGKVGLGICYATSPRGGTHLEGFHDTMLGAFVRPIEELGVYGSKDRFDWEMTPWYCFAFENLMSVSNSLVMCMTISWGKAVGSWELYDGFLGAVEAMTGMQIPKPEMMKIGERNYALRKVLAAREGYGRSDDDLPTRMKEPLPEGASANRPIPDAELQKRIDEYYTLRGFNEAGPTPERLTALGMGDVIGYLPAQ